MTTEKLKEIIEKRINKLKKYLYDTRYKTPKSWEEIEYIDKIEDKILLYTRMINEINKIEEKETN